ncbi:MAG: ketose-bisphosphate aldolase [Armatimonadota bacterium]
MPLADTLELLRTARREGYAVPAFDVSNYETFRAAIEGAEAERSPVILMVLQLDAPDGGLDYLSALIKRAAERSSVPVACHLDHALDPEWALRAVDLGFSSVMIDGSALPFNENVAVTRQVVDYARPRGVGVEAELGHVGFTGHTVDESPGAAALTVPEEVVEFVAQTQVDALAVAIGTCHGLYQEPPNLDLDRLSAIEAVSPVPLVLHGGSGNPDQAVREAIRRGMTKVNIYTELLDAFFGKLREVLARPESEAAWAYRFLPEAIAAARDLVRRKIRLCGSNGKA